MKVEDIKYFFHEIQLKTLKELEKKRKTALYAYTLVIIGAVVLVLGFIVFIAGIFYYSEKEFYKKINPYTEPVLNKIYSYLNKLSSLTSISTEWLAGISIVLLIVLGILLYKWIQHRYIDAFKEKINKTLFKRLHPQIKYNPDEHISKEDFKNSHLFVDRSYNYEGGDHCSLRIKNHLIEFSELSASVTRPTGRHSSTEVIYFHGLFMKLHLKTTGGFIGIIPKQNKKGFLSILEDKKVRSFKGKQKLDLPEDFGRIFDVYSDDASQAQKILTDDVKKNILQMHSQFDQNIYLAFQGDFIYIAVECGAFFEPPLKKAIQVEDLKKTALLLNSFINSASSMIHLLSRL